MDENKDQNTVTEPGMTVHHESVTTASPPPTNSLSTAGMVCGIVGVVFSIIPFVNFFLGTILGILATVFGAIAKKQDGSGKSGIILGVITLAVTMLWAIGFLVVIVFNSTMDSSTF